MVTVFERRVAEAGRRRDGRLARDPARRRRRGIVHTPPELARFVARAADDALRERLGRRGGLADPAVGVVDPACGPGAFLAAALAVTSRRGGGGPAALVGVDLDRAALASARASLSDAAARRDRPLTLRRADTLATLRPWPRAVAPPTAVVLGNPPWAGRTANRGAATVERLLEDFRRDAAGAPLGERKIGVLSDDYVRFWRWSAELVRRAPRGGVVALVTNASFVDGPVHRGMRAALARWFDGIDVVDLGGSALVARDGGRDDNVFGVRPAVAVTVAWRCGDGEADRRARVRGARLRGRREDKLERLGRARLEGLRWRRLRPEPPSFAWAAAPPRRSRWLEDAVPLSEAMPFHREGVQTNRDAVAIDADRRTLLARLRAFARGRGRGDLGPALAPSGHYDPERARRAVREALAEDPDGALGQSLRPIAYRPGDDRWLAPVAPLCHRPRPALLRAMDAAGWALLTVRKDRGERPWAHVGASRHVPDNCWLSARSSCRTRAFPVRGADGEPNLAPELAERWSERLGVAVDADGFARYALAILASATYRRACGDALRRDYPRVPVPPDADGWARLVAAGEALRAAACDASPDAPTAGPCTIGHWRIDAAPAAWVQGVDAADAAFVDVFGRSPGAIDAPRGR